MNNTNNGKIYLVFLATEETITQEVIIKQWVASDAFLTLDEAVAAGKKALKGRFVGLCKFFGKNYDKDDIADVVNYRFTIFEYDPAVARNEDGWWEMYARWTYNHNGMLQERTEHRTIRIGDKTEQHSTVRFPDDDAEDAGCKFNVGDFVTVANDEDVNQIYVVSHAPGKRENWPKRFVIFSDSPTTGQPESGENFYTVDGFDKNGLFTHIHPHETELRRFVGEIPPSHPLQILKKHYLGEIKINDDLFDDIFCRRIVFDNGKSLKSWRSIPELFDVVQ